MRNAKTICGRQPLGGCDDPLAEWRQGGFDRHRRAPLQNTGSTGSKGSVDVNGVQTGRRLRQPSCDTRGEEFAAGPSNLHGPPSGGPRTSGLSTATAESSRGTGGRPQGTS